MSDKGKGGGATGSREWTGNLHAAIIAASQDPIYFCSPDYIIREANEPYAAIGGFTREQAIGRTVQEVAGASAFEHRKPYLARALAGEAAVLQDWHERAGIRPPLLPMSAISPFTTMTACFWGSPPMAATSPT